MNIPCLETMSNNLPWQKTKRRWRWIGQTLRKPLNHITRETLTCNSQLKKKKRSHNICNQKLKVE